VKVSHPKKGDPMKKGLLIGAVAFLVLALAALCASPRTYVGKYFLEIRLPTADENGEENTSIFCGYDAAACEYGWEPECVFCGLEYDI